LQPPAKYHPATWELTQNLSLKTNLPKEAVEKLLTSEESSSSKTFTYLSIVSKPEKTEENYIYACNNNGETEALPVLPAETKKYASSSEILKDFGAVFVYYSPDTRIPLLTSCSEFKQEEKNAKTWKLYAPSIPEEVYEKAKREREVVEEVQEETAPLD